MRFEDLLENIDIPNFFKNYWTKKELYIKDGGRKLSAIISLKELESEINQHLHTYSFPKIEFIKDGQLVPFEEYSEMVQVKRIGWQRQYSIKKVNKLNSLGYTMTMRRIDQLTTSLTKLRGSLEHEFMEKINMNGYVSHPSAYGFNPHYDTHEVFVFQIAGRKRWKVFGSNYRDPLVGQFSKLLDSPNSEVTEYILDKGDVLYIPRGVWHSAYAHDVSSFHITIGVHCKKIGDMLAEELNKYYSIRANLRSPSQFLNRQASDLNFEDLKGVINNLTTKDIDFFDVFNEVNNHEEGNISLSFLDR